MWIGEITIFSTDLERSLRFWSAGAGMRVVERNLRDHTGYVVLEFAEGGAALVLMAPVDPWEEGRRPEHGASPQISFNLYAEDFDGALARLTEHGGTQIGDIESYAEARSVTIADPDGNTFDLYEVREGGEFDHDAEDDDLDDVEADDDEDDADADEDDEGDDRRG
ncbi:MAG: hypothetical protein CHACPFDD_02770 [Phycisphaerae bacterium]|nr:hypothetical protein [Phycisphaerae bacterium]